MGSDVALDVFGAPNLDFAVFPACCEEHLLILGHSDAVNWILVLMKGSDEAALWSMLLCRSPGLSQCIPRCECRKRFDWD